MKVRTAGHDETKKKGKGATVKVYFCQGRCKVSANHHALLIYGGFLVERSALKKKVFYRGRNLKNEMRKTINICFVMKAANINCYQEARSNLQRNASH